MRQPEHDLIPRARGGPLIGSALGKSRIVRKRFQGAGGKAVRDRRGAGRGNFPAPRDSAGKPAKNAAARGETTLDFSRLRPNSLRGRAGNFFAPSRESAGNFSRAQGI